MSNLVNFPDRSSIEEEAALWIAVFEGDDRPTEKDITELKQWMSRSPVHRETLIRLVTLWSDMDVLEELSVPTTRRRPSTQIPQLKGTIPYCINWFGQQLTTKKLATSIAFICIVGVITAAVLKPHFGIDKLSNGHYSTEVGKQAKLDLPDGSTIWLNTRSEIEVKYSRQRRHLILHRGEAFFEVAKNPSRPFEVFAAGKMARAVGTAFSVYRHIDGVEVTVTEGIVDLSLVSEKKPDPDRNAPARPKEIDSSTSTQRAANTRVVTKVCSLTAGQSVRLQPNGTQPVIDRAYQDIARSLSWRDGLLVFAGESLENVVKEISRYTSLKITLADPEIGSMRIGGQFKTGHTEALFDVLQAGFGLEVAYLSDNQVAIYSGKKNNLYLGALNYYSTFPPYTEKVTDPNLPIYLRL